MISHEKPVLGHNILVVGENGGMIDSIRATLRGLGAAQVTGAATSEEAISKIKDRIAPTPQFLITDLDMPGSNITGPALVGILHREFHIEAFYKLLACSQKPTLGEFAHIKAAGITDVLARPFAMDELIRKVRQVIVRAASVPASR